MEIKTTQDNIFVYLGMTIEEKKIAVLIWLATDIFAQAPNNTDGYIIQQMQKRYPELNQDRNFIGDLHDILDNLKKDGFVDTQSRGLAYVAENGEAVQREEFWYSASLDGKSYAKELLKKRDVLKYIRRAGMVDNKLSPLQMTDKVLEWFCMDINDVLEEKFSDTRQRVSRSFVTEKDAGIAIVDHFIKDGYKELNSTEFSWYYPMVISKLVDDGYITYDEKSKHYSQNMHGIIFWENGGYIGEVKRNNLEERRVRISQTLTWILAVGITATFVKDLFEVLRERYNPLLKPTIYYVVPILSCLFLFWLIRTILQGIQIGKHKNR